MKKTFKYSLLAGLVVSGLAQAEEFRQHEAHVHGHVEFNIAQDGKELLVEITAPGADVVGFEHAPENEEQHHKIEDAEKVLKNASDIILLSSAASCKVEHVEVRNTLEGDDHEGHDHDKHEEHDHHDHNKHDHDSHEGHEGHDHENKHGGHGEFTIEYHFECDDIAKLNQIDTSWFKHFPSTEEIDVNLLTDTAQIAAELNKNSTVIKF
ncbi:DUF2796 domain-containing protein [Vibrio hannami]|uniref:zinc uptake protein ZrgA n=1 Tax=Vibrio hannami TaxID=2717094 RepID=UPI0024108AD1|nr:DUF2796 domain-containing protein [Vibrio hannami]MDG3087023.1 DUF2796 domain-containing protein [Vibrio hannami]